MALNSYSTNKIVRFAFLVMKGFNRKGVEKVTYKQDVNRKRIVSFLMLIITQILQEKPDTLTLKASEKFM